MGFRARPIGLLDTLRGTYDTVHMSMTSRQQHALSCRHACPTTSHNVSSWGSDTRSGTEWQHTGTEQRAATEHADSRSAPLREDTFELTHHEVRVIIDEVPRTSAPAGSHHHPAARAPSRCGRSRARCSTRSRRTAPRSANRPRSSRHPRTRRGYRRQDTRTTNGHTPWLSLFT